MNDEIDLPSLESYIFFIKESQRLIKEMRTAIDEERYDDALELNNKFLFNVSRAEREKHKALD
jgi:hypothetical protein